MPHSYDEAIAYLERLVAAPLQKAPEAALERTRLLLQRLGNPHERFVTIHIVGSSGKGSTAALTAGIMRAAGYRVGLFTSPHLVDYVERVAVDGVPIPRDDWVRLLDLLRPTVDAMARDELPGYALGRPALLQVLWPLAARYFADERVDVAVVEAGMGGRYDSTNVNNARVAVVTNVSLEHVAQLGPTVESIAWHKAGVARRGGILVTAAIEPALTVIAAECARQGTTMWAVGPRGGATAVQYGGENALAIETPVAARQGLTLGPVGVHQHANAACAVAAVDAVQSLGLLPVADGAIRRGLETVRVHGRLERVATDPTVWLDGAHNPDAARALAVALPGVLSGAPMVLLLGILGDKDLAAMVDVLAPLAQDVVVAEPPWAGRAGHGREVMERASHHVRSVTYVPDPACALAVAREHARDRGAVVVVTGSLILVGAVRAGLVDGAW